MSTYIVVFIFNAFHLPSTPATTTTVTNESFTRVLPRYQNRQQYVCKSVLNHYRHDCTRKLEPCNDEEQHPHVLQPSLSFDHSPQYKLLQLFSVLQG